MTNSSPNSTQHSVPRTHSWINKTGCWVLATRYFPPLFLFTLYLITLAQTPVLGDPSEYTFVAHVLGIAHPPGYAFITVVGKLFQTLIPLGEVAWRMHVLAAVAGTVSAVFVYGTVRTVTNHAISAVFAALVVGTAVNFWQHSIHANPHIITATFLAANLYFLTRWWRAQYPAASTQYPANSEQWTVSSKRWLWLFCVSAGLGVTHHPLTVFSFPAYALFILWVRPKILTDWRTLLKMVLLALAGLSLWLYYPIRSSMNPLVGPTTMNTLDGFLTHVLGRGLTENLPYFALADQPSRALVFWSILRLQYAVPISLLALVGFWGKSFRQPHPIFLYALAFLCNYAFVISLRAQDIMAYLLGPLLVVGVLAGLGLHRLTIDDLRLTIERFASHPSLLSLRSSLLALAFLLGPVWQIGFNLPRVSLQGYDEGAQYVSAVFEQFAGKNEGAVLLNDWEHMTPLWYSQFVEGRWPETADVRPLLVAAGTANPWLEAVFQHLPGGPVYLSNYRRSIVDAGFRLRPIGPFYQVVEPGDGAVPEHLTKSEERGANECNLQLETCNLQPELVGYLLPETAVSAGDYVPLTLAMRLPMTTTHFFVPVVHVGNITYAFTTDSHLTTPNWLPNEVIVERFDFALPHDLPTGKYPVRLDFKNLSTNEDVILSVNLGELAVTGQADPVETEQLLANFRQEVGLAGATAWSENGRFSAPWPAPIYTQPGQTIHLTLEWQALAHPQQSYTVFVHLIDAANQPLVALDYTPLGGSTPTYLWIPKWLPDQQMVDPYRLQIPPDLPPGTYAIEVGLYETAYEAAVGRRLHIADQQGNIVGDRYILGAVVVGGG